MIQRFVATCVATLILAATIPSGALAQAPGDEPKDRFNQGVELAKYKKYEQAVALWLDVLEELDDTWLPRAHKALGLAYKKLDRLPDAAYHLERYVALVSERDSKAEAWLADVTRELEPTHARVSFVCDPGDARVEILPNGGDGHSSATELHYPCPFAFWLTPGAHRVRATKEGYHTVSLDVQVPAGEKESMKGISLEPIDATWGPPKASPSVVQESPPEASDASRVAWPPAVEWTLIGSGAALSIVAGVIHGLALSRNDELHDLYGAKASYPDGSVAKVLYDAAYDEQVRPKENTAYVLYGVGGAAVVTGVILMVVREGTGASDTGGAVNVSAVPVREGAMGMVEVGF